MNVAEITDSSYLTVLSIPETSLIVYVNSPILLKVIAGNVTLPSLLFVTVCTTLPSALINSNENSPAFKSRPVKILLTSITTDPLTGSYELSN